MELSQLDKERGTSAVSENSGTVGVLRCRWCRLDGVLTVTELNGPGRNYLGLKGKQVIEKGLLELQEAWAREMHEACTGAMEENAPVECIVDVAGKQVKAICCPAGEEELQILLTVDKRAREGNSDLMADLQEWENTFDAIGDLVTIQDCEMNIVRANRAAHEMFGHEYGALVGEKCYKAFQDSSRACILCPVVNTVSGRQNCTGVVFNEKLQRTFDVRSSPIINENGDLKWVVHIARDVTRESALEKQLQQAMKMEAIGTLAGGIAHDFNNILSAIIGYGHIAQAKLERNDPVQDDLGQILAGADRAVDLVKQILTFSRQETKEQLNPLKIQYIAKEVLKLMRSSLPSTIELRQQLDNSCPPILADPGQIHQLLMNLFTNGKQAIGGEHGMLRLVLREESGDELRHLSGFAAMPSGKYVHLMLEDDGCGMDAKMLERIFDPFFTTKAKEHGTGLGLAVVHGIVKKHGGVIGVESEPGQGTTFHIAFPVTQKEAPADRRSKALSPTGSEKIMVVDDEEAVGKVIGAMLKRLGYTVITHTDSMEAVRCFREDPYCCDLVLTDMTMPNMTGSELGRELISLRPALPVIMMTGFSESIDKAKSQQMGIREFLLKPIKKDVLARVLREVLAGGPDPDC